MSLTNGGIGKKLNKIAVTYGSIYTGILLWSIISALNANFNFLPDLIVKFNSYSLPFSSDMVGGLFELFLFEFFSDDASSTVHSNGIRHKCEAGRVSEKVGIGEQQQDYIVKFCDN